MEFIEQLQNWEKAEVLQGKIMFGVGLLLLVAFVAIIRSENTFFKGMLIPFGLLLTVLIGYGGYILQSRPAHVKSSIELYNSDQVEAVKQEMVKHETDNKAGKTLLKIYPILIILSVAVLFFVTSQYYKGMALGFALLFISTNIIDNGFVTRSDVVIEALNH